MKYKEKLKKNKKIYLSDPLLKVGLFIQNEILVLNSKDTSIHEEFILLSLYDVLYYLALRSGSYDDFLRSLSDEL